jgi:exopolysaccharide biosynthesis predicted pyruvyltransferase EpsI
MSFKEIILKHRNSFRLFFRIRKLYLDKKLYKSTCNAIRFGAGTGKKIVYYCGIPAHGNLGDLAQGVCIRRWIKKNYPDYHITEIETNAIVNTGFSCIKVLAKYFDNMKDFVVFQSGYTTTDLGGFADYMHQVVIESLPHAKILMMPQTIFFKSEKRKLQCSQVYNNHSKMLFLARDKVSFETAKEMFPSIPKMCYPDIVTTMIGTYESNSNRDGIIFCLRDDGEKYYSDEALQDLIKKCEGIAAVSRTDTTKGSGVVKNAEDYIYAEIKEYSKYKVMVTDRYHGTILSLVAGTPVIILKTTDHKVTTGADWFKGIYDEYVNLADNLEEAFSLVNKVYHNSIKTSIKPYFESKYYDILPKRFEELVGDND